ncbi:hypothetical protein A5678_06975 [Mycobacterium sp. E2733]|nr:hypothetical protein A5678_06975 [Mycobacterium sp. E2733]
MQPTGRQRHERDRLHRADPVESRRGKRRAQPRHPRRGHQVHHLDRLIRGVIAGVAAVRGD